MQLLHVATAPAFRNLGVGSALVGALLEYASKNGARLVLLDVRRSNQKAIRLYRRFGFSVIGLRRAYYPDTDEDAVEMMLRFDPHTGSALPGCDEIHIDG